jgi:misacylated tRNA(Ala) deacylase
VTELSYLGDGEAAYTGRFVARIVALPPGGVVLDRTFFYPAGGGQPADHGTLGLAGAPPLPVVDVTRSGPSVVHRVRRGSSGAAPWRVGDELEGVIDWTRRHRHMRLHTGQHLLSALIFQRTGIRTQEANMSGSGGTIDIERPLSPGVGPEELATEANRILQEGRPVSIHYVPRSEWDRNPSPRSGRVALPRQVDPVRIIEIAGLDSCPCGGTHVRSTREVGTLAVDPPVPIALGAVRLPFRLVGEAAPPA